MHTAYSAYTDRPVGLDMRGTWGNSGVAEGRAQGERQSKQLTASQQHGKLLVYRLTASYIRVESANPVQ